MRSMYALLALSLAAVALPSGRAAAGDEPADAPVDGDGDGVIVGDDVDDSDPCRPDPAAAACAAGSFEGTVTVAEDGTLSLVSFGDGDSDSVNHVADRGGEARAEGSDEDGQEQAAAERVDEQADDDGSELGSDDENDADNDDANDDDDDDDDDENDENDDANAAASTASGSERPRSAGFGVERPRSAGPVRTRDAPAEIAVDLNPVSGDENDGDDDDLRALDADRGGCSSSGASAPWFVLLAGLLAGFANGRRVLVRRTCAPITTR